MDKIFKPNERDWISPVVNLGEEAVKLRNMADAPIDSEGQGLEYVPPEQMETGFGTVHDLENSEVKNIINTILKPGDDWAEMDEINASLEMMGKSLKEFDSMNIDYSGSESEDESEGDPHFDESSTSSEEDEVREGTEGGGDGDNLDDTSMALTDLDLKVPSVAVEIIQKIKSLKRDQEPLEGHGADSLQEALDDRDKKHDAEFAVFYEYNTDKARERAKMAIRDEEKFHVGPDMSHEKYLELAKQTSSILAFDFHEVMVDDPVTAKVDMPLLAGPVPHKANRKLTTLALYTSLSDEPGNFQWKSTHVMEQLTASQQAEKQTMREYQRHGLRMPTCFAPEEFIITVSFYQPSELATYDLKSAPEPKPGLEIEVLGSHTLNHLRQMFFCQRNYACAKDCNEYEQWITIMEANDRYEEYLAMNICKGDMMFIHDTCYTDGSKEAADHFANVSKWIEEGTNKEIDPYMEKSMDTEIANMSLRFGYPYLYLHQGDCEHIIVFTSMRLPRPVEFSSFPRHEVVGKYTTKFCRIDKEYLARWIVCGSDRFPEDPILLCNSCVEQYCFTKGTEEKPGTKIGNFQLYPFLQIIAFI